MPEKDVSPDRVHVWPYLVRLELIATIIAIAVLLVWSVAIDAPLEEPANPNRTPNPSKAPWYFLGFQEVLVYFDPWMAGVAIPSLIIVGLMAIPYLDTNPKGSGYYTIKERPFAMSIFLFGFLILWVLLIIVGVFMRGPGWNFFAPWEAWDPHKVQALTNVNLWELLGVEQRSATAGGILGGLTLALYYIIPIAGVYRWGRQKIPTIEQLGMVRYGIVAFLFMTMTLLPIKMILRWTLNIKYLWVWPGVLNV